MHCTCITNYVIRNSSSFQPIASCIRVIIHQPTEYRPTYDTHCSNNVLTSLRQSSAASVYIFNASSLLPSSSSTNAHSTMKRACSTPSCAHPHRSKVKAGRRHALVQAITFFYISTAKTSFLEKPSRLISRNWLNLFYHAGTFMLNQCTQHRDLIIFFEFSQLSTTYKLQSVWGLLEIRNSGCHSLVGEDWACDVTLKRNITNRRATWRPPTNVRASAAAVLIICYYVAHKSVRLPAMF